MVYFSTLIYLGTMYIWNQYSSSMTALYCLAAVQLNAKNICQCYIFFYISNFFSISVTKCHRVCSMLPLFLIFSSEETKGFKIFLVFLYSVQ